MREFLQPDVIGARCCRTRGDCPGMSPPGVKDRDQSLLTKSLAGEWACRGVRVNSISPGYINTPMTPKKQIRSDWYEVFMAFSPMKSNWRAPRDRTCSGLSRFGCKQFFYRKQPGDRRRIYVLVSNHSHSAHYCRVSRCVSKMKAIINNYQSFPIHGPSCFYQWVLRASNQAVFLKF